MINITDNHQGKKLSNITNEDYDNLMMFSNVKTSVLVKDNPNFLVFPKTLGKYKDEIGELCICNLHGSRNNLNEVYLSTGNLMGFVGYGNTQLTIHSRFDNNNEKDYFLHYMLQKVLSLNIINAERSLANEGELNLLIYLFPNFLENALKQGLYKEYKTKNYNNASIKGRIDISAQLKINTPFKGKITYSCRERNFDNPLLQLIRHTIEYIKTLECGNSIISSISKEYVNLIIDNTTTYSLKDRQKVLLATLKDINHPYYTEYVPLQHLCRMILNHKKLNYGQSDKKVYGVIFDGAWLWEEYLAKILKTSGFTHAENKTGKNGIEIYEGASRYPDFYKGIQLHTEDAFNMKLEKIQELVKSNIILDAKYKPIDSYSINRDDIHQIVSYMHIFPSLLAGLIYPYGKTNDKNDFKILISERKIFGFGGTIYTYGIPIPQQVNNAKAFKQSMKEIEKKLKLDNLIT